MDFCRFLAFWCWNRTNCVDRSNALASRVLKATSKWRISLVSSLMRRLGLIWSGTSLAGSVTWSGRAKKEKTMVGFVVRRGKSELRVLLGGHQIPALTCCPSALLSSRCRLCYWDNRREALRWGGRATDNRANNTDMILVYVTQSADMMIRLLVVSYLSP